MKESINTFEQAVAYIGGLPRFKQDYQLTHTKEILSKLGNPDRKKKIIHVAGTNGKGSVCAYTCSLLHAAGYHYCLFTSPHLADIRERFVIDGVMISKEQFLEAFKSVYALSPQYEPTFFEFLFFMAMLIFKDIKTDYYVLETGLGGRMDATNSVSQKEISIITHMGLDHTECLGDTIVKIAYEKAGIMQNSKNTVFFHTDEDVTKVLSDYADTLKISAYEVSKTDYTFLNFSNKTIDFSYRSLYYDSVRLHLHTIARYQMENASLAIRSMEILLGKEHLTRQMIEEGIASAFWAGRMEEILPEVFVDGAHNQDGIRAFLETVSQDGCKSPRKLLFAVVEDKAYDIMIQAICLSGLFTDISVVQMKSRRAVNACSLQLEFSKYWNKDIIFYQSVKEALIAEVTLCKGKQRLYIAGSLYLVGEIKEIV